MTNRSIVKHYLDQPFKYKGKTLYADCYLSAEHDDLDPRGDFDFGNELENARYLKRFESGELQMIRLKVWATFKGFEGADYLGACHIPSDDFHNQCTITCQDHGMITNALADLVLHMETVEATLREVANG